MIVITFGLQRSKGQSYSRKVKALVFKRAAIGKVFSSAVPVKPEPSAVCGWLFTFHTDTKHGIISSWRKKNTKSNKVTIGLPTFKGAIHLNAIFLPFDMALMEISHSRFKQSKNPIIIP